MIKNRKIVQKFEEELIKKEKVNLIKNLQIIDAMYKEARALGVIPMKYPLNGWDIDAKIAMVVNYVPKAS
ncbi:MAG: hypothetical protein KAX30_05780 [Candidatus Atribacteria bacterium]|nr:hypothetical protein [Candidatus Atribacteria bacterium]